jgi:hypothetical protein
MSAEDLLIAITQVAAAIAGFSGLMAAIRTASAIFLMPLARSTIRTNRT